MEQNTKCLRYYDIDKWGGEDVVTIKLNSIERNEILWFCKEYNQYMIRDPEPERTHVDNRIVRSGVLETLIRKITFEISIGSLRSMKYFVRMHHAMNTEPCENSADIVRSLVQSIKTIPDINYDKSMGLDSNVYVTEYCTIDPVNYFRVFIYSGKVIGASQMPKCRTPKFGITSIRETLTLGLHDVVERYPTSIVDVEIMDYLAMRIFDVDIFNANADLYLLTVDLLCKKTPCLVLNL
jgi:hypothetical protein